MGQGDYPGAWRADLEAGLISQQEFEALKAFDKQFFTSNPIVLLIIYLACGEKPASATTSKQAQSPAAAATTKGPTITLSKTRLAEGEHVLMKGSGFTPLSDAISHLK